MIYSNSSILKIVKKLSLFMGVDIKRTKSQNTLESHLLNLLNEYNIDLVIDVGANTGQYAQLLRMIGYNGRIISFEPLESAYKELSSNARGGISWTTVNLALGDSKGKVSINEYGSSVFSSMLEPSNFGTERFGRGLDLIKKYDVNVCTLNEYFEENHISANNILLKMDTQGYDLNVFRGASNIIDMIALLQSEISFIPVYKDTPSYNEIISYYESCGFFVTGMFPVSRGPGLSLIEADLVMANANRLPTK